MTVLAHAVQDVSRYLPAWLQRQLDRSRTPGAQVALRLDGTLAFSGAFGLADTHTGERLTTSHIFRVASHSKWFTTSMTMRLVAEGLLRLDDRLGARVAAYADTPLANVTLRELLSHRAGVIRDGVRSDFWQLEGEFPDAAALLGLVRRHGRVLEPEEFFKYTNVGFSLVGQILESAAHASYHELMIDEICRPLGLTRTMPEYDPAWADEFASGHGRAQAPSSAREVLRPIQTGAMAPATGFCSTAEDLTAFGGVHFLGGDDDVIGDVSRRRMQHPLSDIQRPDGTGHYGLGTQIADVGGRRVIGHSGGFPGYITRTWVDPGERMALSVLTNAIDGPADPLASGILKLVELATSPRRPWQAASDAATLDAYTGRFESLWGVVDVVRLGDRLVAIDPDVADPAGGLEELTVRGPDELDVERRDSYRSAGEPLVFERGTDGHADTVRITGQLHRRVAPSW